MLSSGAIALASNSPKSTLKAPPCRIDIGDVHPSTYYAERHRVHTIKVNIDSLCDQPLTQVHIHVLIFKTGFLVDHLVKRYDNPVINFIPANKKYLLEDVTSVCRNWKVTTFYAEAYGEASEKGVLVSTPMWKSRNQRSIDCGT